MEHSVKRSIIVLGWVAVVTGIALVLLFLYWLIYPYNPLEFKGERFRVLTPVVKSGGSLQFVSDYCKNMELPATLLREFVNELLFAMPPITTNRELGCHNLVISMKVPEELPEGTYHLENTYVYEVNLLRKIVIKHSSDSFTVRR